uniref:Uncharacterized protein n=1 Tax=Tetradesmus obliquus TaxID=3088 RepID=A0A383W2B1_TETOB
MKLAQQQGRSSPCTPCSRGSSSNRPMHRPVPGLQQQARMQHTSSRPLPQPPAAAAADLTASALPYISPRGPKLHSRRMQGSPMDGLWGAASAALLRLELAAAAAVDRHARYGPLVASGLAGVAAGMGIDAFTLLQYGLPGYFQDLLLAAFGAWDTTLWAVALTAAALPVTAWAVRCWWAASMQLLGGEGGAVQQVQQMIEQQDQQASSSSSSSNSGGSAWVAGVVGIARALLISSAVGSFSSALSSSSSSVVTAVVAALSGVVAAAAAAAPVALQLVHWSSSKRSPSNQAVAVQLLVLEAAWTAAMVGVAPLLNFAAAAGIAATLLSLHKQVVAPRLLQYQAAAGDRFQAHISLKLSGSAVAFDTTISAEPVSLVAAQRSSEHAQNWKQLGSDDFWEKLAAQQDADAPPAAAAGEAGAATPTAAAAATAQLRSIAQGVKGWLGTPAARWEPLLPFVADAACSMFVGETRSVQLLNPKAGGYWNPSFSWWQPTADVMAKFRGQMPAPGDVFLYPVSEGAYVPTRVAAIGEKYVELDANYGVTGAALQLEVTLVALQKQ